MTSADLRRAVLAAPMDGFRLVLSGSNWPIACLDPAWSISPSGSRFYHWDQEGRMRTIKAAKIERVEYLP